MANLRLTLSCGDYDRTRFLIEGRVATPGLELDVIPLVSQERHARFSRNLEFDVCELQMGVYLGWKSRGVPVTAIPVFPHVKFCHGAVVVHSGSGIESPGDLRGKRVGLQAHFNPIAVWMRGVLKHEHGVSPDEMRWVTNSVEQVSPWEPPEWLHIEKAPAGRRVPEMLEAGEIDAYMLPTLGVVVPRRKKRGTPALAQLPGGGGGLLPAHGNLPDPAHGGHQGRGPRTASLGRIEPVTGVRGSEDARTGAHEGPEAILPGLVWRSHGRGREGAGTRPLPVLRRGSAAHHRHHADVRGGTGGDHPPVKRGGALRSVNPGSVNPGVTGERT